MDIHDSKKTLGGGEPARGFPAGSGKLRAQMRRHDWAPSSLGAPSTWPQALKTAIQLMLGSRQPMCLWWGSDLLQFYNDAFVPILGERAEWALGQPFKEVWPDVWTDVLPFVRAALSGEGTWSEDLPLVMSRNGYDELTYWTFSYSPVHDDDGHIAGVLNVVTETTRFVKDREVVRESEAMLSSIFAEAAVGLSVASLDGRFIRVNDELCRILGRSRDELLTMNVADVIFPDDAVENLATFGKVVDTGRSSTVDKRYLRPDGAIVWANSALSRLDDDQGCPRAVLRVTVDLTERHEQEQGLRESEARYRLALEAGKLGSWNLDLRDWKLSGSTLFKTHFGRDAKMKFTYDDLQQAIDPDNRDCLMAAIEQSVANGQDFDIECKVNLPSGDKRWLQIRGQSVRDANGFPVRMAGVTLDVTERKYAQAVLRERELRHRLALEAAQLGAWELEIATGRAVQNARHDEIFGYAIPSNWSYDRFLSHVIPTDRAMVSDVLRGAVETEGTWHFECRIIRVDDEQERWIEAWGEPHHDPLSGALKYIGVVADITERKKVEEQQGLLVRELHHRVKNNLATVHSIINFTLRTSDSIEAFQSGIANRISALARTHDLLTDNKGGGVDLDEIIRRELEPYDDGQRIILQGSQVHLTADIASVLAMAVHELTTNAVKHGCLSNSEGRLSVGWSATKVEDGRRLVLEWSESGGPSVTAPTRRGFGSTLLEGLLTHQLGASVQLIYEPAGVQARIEAVIRDETMRTRSPETVGEF